MSVTDAAAQNAPYETIQPGVSVLTVIDTDDEAVLQAWSDGLKAQQYRNYEVLIVNASQNARIAEMLSALCGDSRFILCGAPEDTANIGALYNLAFSRAKGVCVMPVPPAVALQNDCLWALRAYLFAHEAQVAFGQIVCPDGAVYGGQDTNIQDLRSLNVLSEGSVIMRRDIFKQGGFMSEQAIAQGFCFHELYYRLSRSCALVWSGVKCGTGRMPDACTARYSAAASRSEDAWLFSECISPSCAQGAAKKRALVLVPRMSASSTLCLERMEMENCVIRFVRYCDFEPADLQGCDCLINVRGLFDTESAVRLAEQCRIPCYYFMDDNLIALHEETPQETSLKGYTAPLMREELTHYKAVLCFSKALADAAEADRLHAKIHLFEPIMSPWRAQKKPNDIFTAAFMGELSQKRQAEDSILPALQKLSEKIPIRFVCPSFVDSAKYASENLEIYTVPSTESLDQTVKCFGSHPIDVLLCCAEKTRGVVTALMNAAQIGAALTASEHAPFGAPPQEKSACLWTDDTIDSWASAILRLQSDPALRAQICLNAAAYCAERFSGRENAAVLEKLFAENETAPDYDALRDFPASSKTDPRPVFKKMRRVDPALPPLNVPLLMHYYHHELFVKRDIDASRPFVRGRFPLRGVLVPISSVSVIVGTYGHPVCGALRLRIMCGNTALRQSLIDLEGTADNGLLTFRFHPLVLPEGHKAYGVVDRLESVPAKNSSEADPPFCLYKYKRSFPLRAMERLLPDKSKFFYLVQ